MRPAMRARSRKQVDVGAGARRVEERLDLRTPDEHAPAFPEWLHRVKLARGDHPPDCVGAAAEQLCDLAH